MSETIKSWAEVFSEHWPVLFRGALYFMIAALPVFVTALKDVVDGKSVSVSGAYWALASVTAVYQGLVAIRAFYDGSAQRHADYRESIPTK